MADVARELGTDPRTARRRVELAERLKSYPDLREKVDSGRMERRRALRVARTREACMGTAPRVLPANIRIVCCDFRSLKLPANSVDLVFTDPPYRRRDLPLWSDLAEWSARILKPGHLLVTYAGQFCLPEIIERLSGHLQYVWIGGVVFRGHHPNYYVNKMRVRAKPVLFFSNGTYQPQGWVEDWIVGTGQQKDIHPWQQGADEAEYSIKAISKPDSLIVDPCVGSGTSAIACKRLGRRFVGCDVDARAVRIAKKRMADRQCSRVTLNGGRKSPIARASRKKRSTKPSRST